MSITFQNKDKLDIKVTPKQKIILRVPTGKTLDEIKSKVESKRSWILRQLDFFDNHPIPLDTDELKSGSSFRLLGQDHLVIVDQGHHGKIEIKGKFINVWVDDPAKTKVAR